MEPDLSDPYVQARLIASQYARANAELKTLVLHFRDDLGFTENESKAVLYLVGTPKDFADVALLTVYRGDEVIRLLRGEIASMPI